MAKIPCIFCLADTANSRTIEHIIPESLGNAEHVLPAGVVCDACNNYFGRKIEGPLLSSEYFKWLRSNQWVQNKMGRVPPMNGIMPSIRRNVDVWMDGAFLMIAAQQEKHQQELEEAMLSGRAKRVFIPFPKPFDQWLMSRFLGKVSIEALAARLMETPGWREEMLGQEAMAPLRYHVRSGNRASTWKFSHRRLYDPNQVFVSEDGSYEILHEFDFVYTEKGYLFFVLALFGEEFVIDMGSPTLEDYEQWLKSKQNRSALAPWPFLDSHK